jgi:hypothetical protein
MITVELTPKQIEYLTEQSRLYGRFGLLIETDDGQFVSVVLAQNRRDRRKAAVLRAAEAEAK